VTRPPNQWDSVPLRVLIRELDTFSLSEPNRIHLKLWVERLIERIPDRHDIARQTEARSAAITYAGVLQAGERAMALTPGTDDADRAWAHAMRLQEHMRKCLRSLGLKAEPKSKGGRGAKGGGFSPPRSRRPSELQAEQVTPGQESAE
jgi:hypothetical protein